MNRHVLADERSRVFHTQIAKKLRVEPQLWSIPEHNLQRWKKRMGSLPLSLYEWDRIFHTYSKEDILEILESNSEEAQRLRSSSPFTGILTSEERDHILRTFERKVSTQP